jgi:hypothetical protein
MFEIKHLIIFSIAIAMHNSTTHHRLPRNFATNIVTLKKLKTT